MNRPLQSLHGGSLEIKLTVPLRKTLPILIIVQSSQKIKYVFRIGVFISRKAWPQMLI